MGGRCKRVVATLTIGGMMRLLNNILMLVIALAVLWSLVGISAQKAGGETRYSLFIKTSPSAQLVFEQ